MNDWVPFLQTLAWISLIVGVLYSFRSQFKRIAVALTERVEHGGALEFKTAWFSATLPELQGMRPVEPATSDPGAEEIGDTPDWTLRRQEEKRSNRDVHLVHVATPSKSLDGWFDLFIYLIGHQRGRNRDPADLADVAGADFYLGRHWTAGVFKVNNSKDGRPLGLSTSAYGPTLCVCRVRFEDGYEVVLSRYIDFESAKLVPIAAPPADSTTP